MQRFVNTQTSKMSRVIGKSVSIVLVALGVIHAAHSAVVVPQGVNLLSGTKTNETPLSRLIDGSGLSDQSSSADLTLVTHNSNDNNEARLFTSPVAVVRLDLGSVYDLDEAFYWNTNTAGFNDVAFIRYDFLDSGLSTVFDSGNVAVPGPFNLLLMPSASYDPGAVQHVRFIDVTFTRRADGDSFAPGEIRFNGIASVPLPAAAWLFVSGLTGLLAFRKIP